MPVIRPSACSVRSAALAVSPGCFSQVVPEHGRFVFGQGTCASGVTPSPRRQARSAVLAVQGQPLGDAAHRVAARTEERHLVLDLRLVPDQFPAFGGGQVGVGQLGHQLIAELGDGLVTVLALFWGHGFLPATVMMAVRLRGDRNPEQRVA